MDMYAIEGGHALRGTVHISGSKNACLPLMCAALLADGPTILENVPDLRDIRSMIDLLEHLNARVVFKNGRMMIDPREFDTDWVPYDMMRRMRASMYAFGPMIARRRRAAVSKPGGCNIGSRPIDLHLRGFAALGVHMVERKGYVHARHAGLRGAELDLAGSNGPSVGATCNVLMAAAVAQGLTVIHNAAREPEVQELCGFLKAMGARIEGVGTHKLTIEGVPKLSGTKWRVCPDRIETATFAVAALITDGDLLLKSIDAGSLGATLDALRACGGQVDFVDETSLRVRRADGGRLRPARLHTEPFPGLATDVQPLFTALLGLAAGESLVEETIYPDRFMHVEELNRLGASMRIEGPSAAITGVEHYDGAAVMASDLRAGAALVLAALAAEGESQVRRIYHIERGYERFDQKLAAVGARMRRIDEGNHDPGLNVDFEEVEEVEELIPQRPSRAEIETMH